MINILYKVPYANRWKDGFRFLIYCPLFPKEPITACRPSAWPALRACLWCDVGPRRAAEMLTQTLFKKSGHC